MLLRGSCLCPPAAVSHGPHRHSRGIGCPSSRSAQVDAGSAQDERQDRKAEAQLFKGKLGLAAPPQAAASDVAATPQHGPSTPPPLLQPRVHLPFPSGRGDLNHPSGSEIEPAVRPATKSAPVGATATPTRRSSRPDPKDDDIGLFALAAAHEYTLAALAWVWTFFLSIFRPLVHGKDKRAAGLSSSTLRTTPSRR